jgi:capsule biosynthesis phosphatase
MIEYIIKSIPSNEIHIIYNIFLNEYNFKQIVINLFKQKTIYFYEVDFLTRGAVETAYVGINNIVTIDTNEKIVFLDNDNIHTFDEDIDKIQNCQDSFIGYCIDYEKTNYSFIKIDNGNIIDIKEKIKISDTYCCGIYGFKNMELFKVYAKKLIETNYKTKNEFYFSQLYKLMIMDKLNIFPVKISKTNHIGSTLEISNANRMFDFDHKLRICFDLDNTLVTYPTIPNDYSSVKPIQNAIDLLKYFKGIGYEIIIHTARRMKTHNSNVGKVIKDIASVTIDTLEKFNIEYDELIFGKPIADIYIDDRSINPYINDISQFGFFNVYSEKQCTFASELQNSHIGSSTDYSSVRIDLNLKNKFIHNKIKNNKYNTITKKTNTLIKKGPIQFMKGELYFYKNIPEFISNYFPELINYCYSEDNIHIEIEMTEIKGIPLFYLYKNKLITNYMIDQLFDILNKIHNTDNPITIHEINIKNNYFKKIESRFNSDDYNFENATQVYNRIIYDLNMHFSPEIVGIIHGDFWFSNIILDYNDNYKFIDMKGQIDGVCTLNGDKYYDYGKLYQSILGYDLILNNCDIDSVYISNMKTYFLKKCSEINLNIDYLNAVTNSLIFGTFHFIDSNTVKNNVWNFIVSIISD